MRYLKLLAIFYKYSILKELEYRVNFLSNAFMSVFWLVWGIVGVSIFFLHRDKMGDWTFPEVLMVVGLYTFFNGVMESFLRPNIGAVIEQVRDGTFDFVLVKPLNSQFLASLRNIVVWRLVDVIIGLGVIVYALGQLRVVPTLAQIGFFIIMVLSAIIMVYSIWLVMVSFAFWFVRIDNITEVFYAFYEAGRYPVTIYQGVVRVLLTFVVPIAFVTTFPAAALLGRIDQTMTLIGFGMAIGLFIFSNRFWNFALRYYSSASS
ncbi:MAG: ABC-2 family transporter protein [Chloroflexi bacterium]|nr:ABC-2 family transporter protein [Chloroflexota bacterium]